MSDLEFWALSTVALPRLFLPVALLSLVFWLGALILALRLRRRP